MKHGGPGLSGVVPCLDRAAKRSSRSPRAVRIQDHFRDRPPVADAASPSPRILLPSLLVHAPPPGEDRDVSSSVSVARGDVAKRTVEVLVVVPADELRHPCPRRGDRGERLSREARPPLHRPEERLRDRVVVRRARSGERRRHSEAAQRRQQRRCSHRWAVVGVQDDRASRDAFVSARSLDHAGGVDRRLAIEERPADDLAAPHVEHDVEEVRGGAPSSESGDVPRPDLPRARRSMTRRSGSLLAASRRSSPPGAEHSIERGLRRDVDSAVGQQRNELPNRQPAVTRCREKSEEPSPSPRAERVPDDGGAARSRVDEPAAPTSHGAWTHPQGPTGIDATSSASDDTPDGGEHRSPQGRRVQASPPAEAERFRWAGHAALYA